MNRRDVKRYVLGATVTTAMGSSMGCYTTTLHSGSPGVAAATVEYDDKWHHGLVLGMAEVSGPYDLHRACPTGWSEIKTETSFLNGLVELFTSGIYSSQTITIRCAVAPPPPSVVPSAPAPEALGPSR